MQPVTTLKPTFSGPRLPIAKAGRVPVSRAAVRVRAGPYDEELIATAVRRPPAYSLNAQKAVINAFALGV